MPIIGHVPTREGFGASQDADRLLYGKLKAAGERQFLAGSRLTIDRLVSANRGRRLAVRTTHEWVHTGQTRVVSRKL